MKFVKQLSSLMTAALLCGTFTTLSSAQQTAGSGVVAPAPVATSAPAQLPQFRRRRRTRPWLNPLLLSPKMLCAPATSAS